MKMLINVPEMATKLVRPRRRHPQGLLLQLNMIG